MKAVIMAGGFGTRLRPMTEGIPKPCVLIVGEPCIVRIVRNLSRMGIREFHVSLFYLPEQIKQALDIPEFSGLKFVFHQEAVPLGTAGSVRNCLTSSDEELIIVSGDCLFDYDLTDAISFHRSHNGPLTILSARVSDPGEYGILLAEPSGKITRFLEKPDWAHVYSDVVNTGMYLCSSDFLDFIPEGPCDFSKDVFPSMMKQGVPLYHYSPQGYWCDVGTVRSYLECNKYLLSRSGDVILSPIDEDTVVESPCYIGKNVRLKNCHIGPYTVVGDHCCLTEARLEGCVLDSGVVCLPGAVGRNAVLCKNSEFHRNVRVGDDCVIGSECEIGAGTTVPAGIKIYPSNRIPENRFVSGNVHHKLRSLLPEEGRILFPYGEDFGGAMMYEIGRALAELCGGDVLIGRAEQRDASAAMTFCGGVLSFGKNVYDTGVNELSQFRFTVRNYAFCCAAFFERNYSNMMIRLYDGNGMPLSTDAGRKLEKLLSGEASCGEKDGVYRVFRGGNRAYTNYLRSFGIPNRLKVKVVSSPVLSPLLPSISDETAEERMRIGSEWVRIEDENGEPFDENLVRIAACISLGRKITPVLFPEFFPAVTEEIASQFGVRAIRIPFEDPTYSRKLFPLTDPNVQALLILNLLEQENCSFRDFISQFPVFSVKQREVAVSLPRSTVMRMLASVGGELSEGIRFHDRSGVVRIVPKSGANAFRICSEASNAETAEELCEFYSMKLKGLKPD
ncbi:MAG: NTP transferase domain-containing protein [Clostridia bacterium]|nr:NTP transferase domain-containing protein [Clostridia bacterium]